MVLNGAGGDLTIGDPPENQKGWRVTVGGVPDSNIPELGLAIVQWQLREILSNIWKSMVKDILI